MNAAVWLGASVFYVVGAVPVFTSEELLRLMPASHSTAARQILLERILSLQIWCGAVAVAHLVVEALYAGKPHARGPLVLALVLFALALAGTFLLHPQLARAHRHAYAPRIPAEQQTQALRSFRNWHHLTQFLHGVMIAGLFVYTWQITTQNGSSRPFSSAKFRG